jgi:hypothetical protein
MHPLAHRQRAGPGRAAPARRSGWPRPRRRRGGPGRAPAARR